MSLSMKKTNKIFILADSVKMLSLAQSYLYDCAAPNDNVLYAINACSKEIKDIIESSNSENQEVK